MIKREETLLHQIFEDLLFTHKDGLAEKTAIWHIPDPRQLLVSPTGTALADECQYSIDWTPDTKPSCEVQSITFSELNLTASHLAKQISKALRNFNDKNPADCVTASSDGPNDERHAQAHSVIAIFMPPGIDRIVTQIACMKLHLAYLPLDRQLSVGRVVQILELISPMMMICSKDYYDILLRSHLAEQTDHFTSYLNDKLDSMNYVINRIPVRIYESLMNTSPTFTDPGIVRCQDRLGTTTEHFFAHVKDPVVVVLFTSGSTTSDPKIVRLRNSQLVNRLKWQWASNVEMNGPGRWKMKHCLEDEYRQKREVILSSTACVFVDAFTELFSALFAGLTVVVPGGLKCASEVCVSDVRILYSLIRFFRITRLTTVPNQLTIWMNQMNLIESKECDADLSSLNTIVVSGDILLPELACTFFHLPLGRGTRLLNFYGTTEVAGDVTAYAFYSEQDVKRATKHIEGSTEEDTMVETSSFVAVGIPISNTTIYIVKRCGENICQRTLPMDLSKQSIIGDPVYPVDWSSMGYQVIEQGCVGEVAITGVPVGVFSDEKATAPASHPLTLDFQEANASRLTPAFLGNHAVYFPGDLGFISPEDHLLYVCGRSDELVKINAVRFLASEVDRLLLRIKENCTRKPSAMSWMEKKVINVYESVTLPVQHPSNGTKQLVCFYVVATDSSNLCGQVNFLSTEIKPVLHGSIEYHSHLTLLKPQSADWAKLSPKPNELSTTMANYLPVYIRPIFLAINRIPVMPTSGKVDKQRLRTLYEDTLTLERENHPPCKEAGGRLGADEVLRTLQKGEKRLKRPNYREQARRVLATILGVDPSVAQDRAGRPRDDEDFYLIGGNSLMAVLALESLRQLGFKVHLETFYQTSTIGRILDSLVPPGFAVLSTGNLLESQLMTESLLSKHIPLNTELDFLNQRQTIYIQEWTGETTFNGVSQGLSSSDIIRFLADAFERKDKLTHAFQLSHAELEKAAATYCRPNGTGIALTVTCQSLEGDARNGKRKERLVGVLLSVPTANIPILSCTPKLTQLQRYFDFCCTLDEVDKQCIKQTNGEQKSLTVVMTGVTPPEPEGLCQNQMYLCSRWDRMMLEILVWMESHLLRIAKNKGFTVVDTLNTCEPTKEVCADLGYRLVKCTRMKAFATSEKVMIDPIYHEHNSYYMVRHLND